MAITPDGAAALITEGNEQGQLFFVDIATGTMSGSPIDMGNGPERIIVTSDGTTAYALEEDILYVIDVVARTFTSTVLPLPGELGGFALTVHRGERHRSLPRWCPRHRGEHGRGHPL